MSAYNPISKNSAQRTPTPPTRFPRPCDYTLYFDEFFCCCFTYFKNSVIKTWRQEDVIVFGTSPKVGTAHETWDVENHNAFGDHSYIMSAKGLWGGLKNKSSFCWRSVLCHIAWIWIWMTKRPGITSDSNFSSWLIGHSSLLEADTTISCHFLWAEMEIVLFIHFYPTK